MSGLGLTLQVIALGDRDKPRIPMAVQRAEGESVVFAWIEWASREARDAAWEKLMADPRMQDETSALPFDGRRLIHGGFGVILDA